MSYRNRSPCQKYFDKSKEAAAAAASSGGGVPGPKESVQKSLSTASRFMNFRRPSDTTSDSGSDDFKLEPLDVDVSSSFSRSSSESCHSATFGLASSARYQCSVKNLSDILDDGSKLRTIEGNKTNNESLDEFKSRLNLRRRINTRQEVFPSGGGNGGGGGASTSTSSSNFTQHSQEDERTDNSCDSTTLKAHKEILRNANMLKQEQVQRPDGTGYTAKMAAFHEASNLKKKFSTPSSSTTTTATNSGTADHETILMNKFDKILRIHEDRDDKVVVAAGSKTKTLGAYQEITRSSTEKFNKQQHSPQQQHAKLVSTKSSHSQVLKAATSIPSLIFANRSLKVKDRSDSASSSSSVMQPTTSNYEPTAKQGLKQSTAKMNLTKKTSIDDEFYSIGGAYKNRRSPLQILGNFVDDKFFKKRWSSTKRAKSTDEITWALANEEAALERHRTDLLLGNSNNNTNSAESGSSSGGSSRVRKKSAGFILGNTKFFDDNAWPGFGGGGGGSSGSGSGKKEKLMNRVSDLRKRKSSNASSHSDSTSLNSVSDYMLGNTHVQVHHVEPSNRHNHLTPSTSVATNNNNSSATNNKQVSAETLAEIEAFEEMLKTRLAD